MVAKDLAGVVVLPHNQGAIDAFWFSDEAGYAVVRNMRVVGWGMKMIEGWRLGAFVTLSQSSQTRSISNIQMKDGKIFPIVFTDKDAVAIRGIRDAFNFLTVTEDWGYPTAVRYKNYLYIATNVGLFKVDLDEDEWQPQLIENAPKGDLCTQLGFRLIIVPQKYPDRICWSDFNNYEAWDDIAYLDLPDNAEVVALHRLADAAIAYTNSATYAISYTGDNITPFAIQHIGFVNLVNRHSVLPIETNEFTGHIVATHRGIWVFSGRDSMLLSAQIINRMQKFIERAGENLRLFYDPLHNEIWVASLSENSAWVFQIDYRTWIEADFPYDVMGYIFTDRYQPVAAQTIGNQLLAYFPSEQPVLEFPDGSVKQMTGRLLTTVIVGAPMVMKMWHHFLVFLNGQNAVANLYAICYDKVSEVQANELFSKTAEEISISKGSVLKFNVGEGRERIDFGVRSNYLQLDMLIGGDATYLGGMVVYEPLEVK